MKSYGQIGYETYARSQNWLDTEGTQLPTWEELKNKYSSSAEVWEQVGWAVYKAVREDIRY
jgi:hypothetical protein